MSLMSAFDGLQPVKISQVFKRKTRQASEDIAVIDEMFSALEAMILLLFTLPDHRFGLVCCEELSMLTFKFLEAVDLAPRRLYNAASTETEERNP